MKQTHPIFAHTFCLQKYRQYLSLGHIREKKNGEKIELYPFLCANDAQQCILFYFEHSFVAKIFAYEKNAKKTMKINKIQWNIWQQKKTLPERCN